VERKFHVDFVIVHLENLLVLIIISLMTLLFPFILMFVIEDNKTLIIRDSFK
jgi:hypothetical protein